MAQNFCFEVLAFQGRVIDHGIFVGHLFWFQIEWSADILEKLAVEGVVTRRQPRGAGPESRQALGL